MRAGHAALAVEWDDETLAAPLRKALSYFGFEALTGGESACVLSVLKHADPLAVPGAARLLSESPEGLRFYRAGPDLYVAFRDTVVHVDMQNGAARGVLGPGFGAMGVALREALLFGVVFYSTVLLLTTRGLRTTHAACLVREDVGWLIAGQSDSGKSTLTMRLVEQGWHYLTDDSVLLGVAGGTVEARPLRRDFCLDPDAALTFPQVTPFWEPHMGDVRKRRLRICELYPDGYETRCTPHVLVFPQIVPEATSRLEKLDAHAALVRLIPHSGTLTLLDADAAAAHLRDLHALVGQAKSYALLAGRDLLDDPAAAARLLRSVAV